MNHYLDTSIVVPLYCQEVFSEPVTVFLREDESSLFISQLVELEFMSALSKKVRQGQLSLESANDAAASFQSDIQSGRYTSLVVKPEHYPLAKRWISQFNSLLRTLDGLHLAIAQAHGLCLITADTGLARSAQTCHVPVQLIGE